MKTVEATVVVPDDRQVTLRLPEEVPPGEHRLVVFIEETTAAAQQEATPTRWDDGLLVYAGQVTLPIKPFIDELRDQRIKQFFPNS
jgi:hypothetical protein